MLTTFYPPYNFGGDGIGVQRLARALARRGHAVTVLHEGDAYLALARGAEPVAVEPEPGIDVVTLRSTLGTVSPLLTHQMGRPVVHASTIRSTLERGYDVTFFHNVSLVGGPGVLREGKGVTIYEAHEHWLVCPTHVLWRHGREPCTGRECLRCTLSYRRPPQPWRWTGYLGRQLGFVDAFIAKSGFSRDKHREFGFRREMDVIPYFLPELDASGARSMPPHPRPYFLFVGRLERIKGLDEVIPSFHGDEGPDLLIAGDGDHAPALREQAAGAPRVRFLGRVAPHRLRAYYEHAIALLVPSVCFETFGIILIEAFRHGVPVIARRIGPFPEIVETARAGYLFDDRGGMEAAMTRLASDPDERVRLAAAGRAAFARHWSEDAVVPLYMDLIRRIAISKGDTALADALDHGGMEP